MVRERVLIGWVALVVGLLAVLNLPGDWARRAKAGVREVLAPLQAAVTSVTRKGRAAAAAARGFGDLVEQNTIMAAELARLRNEVLTLKALEQENLQLREQLRFSRRPSMDVVPAEVIGRDASGWWQTLRLGKGYMDGLEPDQAVITPDGLVGRVLDVSPRTADVLLLSDPSCKVSVLITRTGTYGIQSGQGPSRRGRAVCRVEFLNKDAEIRPGDEVVTSGLGGVYPRGLPIGYVERVEPDATGLAQQAEVLTRADLGGLAYAFVVRLERDPVESLLLQRARGAGEPPR